jgi:hypothetical protein
MAGTAQRPITVKYQDEGHRYWVMGGALDGYLQVPSVTEVLNDMSSFDAGPWWGMRVGMAGVVEMMRKVSWALIANANEPQHIITPDLIPPEDQHFTARDTRKQKPRSLVEKWIVDARRSTNHILDEASDRGTNVHLVLEQLALEQMPDVTTFPEDQRGWVAAIMQWWLDQEPTFLMNEVIVGSAAHRYAGRFDTVVQYPDGRVVLTDLKTSKGVYKKHLRQLALYEAAFDEMGLWSTLDVEPLAVAGEFDDLEVLHARRDGSYTLVPPRYRPEHVLPTVQAYHADRAGWLLHHGVAGLFEDVK